MKRLDSESHLWPHETVSSGAGGVQGGDSLDITQLDITMARETPFGVTPRLLGVEALLGLACLLDRLGDLALGLAERWMWEVEARGGKAEKGSYVKK